jgi:hypothetical protein
VAGAALAALAAGCGGSKHTKPDISVSPDGARVTSALSTNSMTGPLPTIRARTLAGLRGGIPAGPVSLSVSASALRVGINRIGFALTNAGSGPINGARVALYTAAEDGTDLRGPYAAHTESLVGSPRYQSQTTSRDLGAPYTVNVAYVPFDRPGPRIVAALVGLDNKWWPTGQAVVSVSRDRGPPGVGERAIAVHTPTSSGTPGSDARLDTRVPPARDLHRVDFASVVGKRPAVLVFASAREDPTHASAPLLDAVEQVASRARGSVAFVHVEPYRGNRRADGLGPQAKAWHLTSVPWTFVIDRSGRVAARFEGAVSAVELERALGALGR